MDREDLKREALESIKRTFLSGGVELSDAESEKMNDIVNDTLDLFKMNHELKLNDESMKTALNVVVQAYVNAVRILRIT